MNKKEYKTFADRIHWATLCREWKEQWNESIPDSDNINIYSFIEKLNLSMTSDWYVVTDAGSAYYALSQNLKLLDKQKYIVSSSQADMGCALPASIGVALSNPDKQVLCITGDGSFNSNLQELAVIKYHNLPIKIFVLNNSGYLSIRNTQEKFFEGRVYGTSESKGLWFPSLEGIAKAYDIKWKRFTNIVDLNLPEIVNRSEEHTSELQSH